MMWVFKRFKNLLTACCLVLLLLFLVHTFTNFFDSVFYLILQRQMVLPTQNNYVSSSLTYVTETATKKSKRVKSPKKFQNSSGRMVLHTQNNYVSSSLTYVTETATKKSKRVESPKKSQNSSGENDLPLSIQCNYGRLGNQMCSYATLYGLSTLNHRPRIITLSCNAKHLKGIFVGPSKIPSIDKVQNIHPWKLTPFLQAADLSIPPNVNYLEGYAHPCSYTFFDHVKDEIRQEFKFKDPFVQYARDVLRKANVQGSRNVTYVGVHVRRGDYHSWLKAYEGVPVNMEYFRRAIRYFRDKYASVVFVAVSEDRPWLKRNLAKRFGVYVPEEAPSPAHDLALLASCNHTIMSYGTFGFWGAYLAGGEVLYFDKFLKPNTTFTKEAFVFEKMYPPDWRGIVTVNVSQYFRKDKSV